MFRVDYREREGIPLGYNIGQYSQEFGDIESAEQFYDDKQKDENVLWMQLIDLDVHVRNGIVVYRQLERRTKVY